MYITRWIDRFSTCPRKIFYLHLPKTGGTSIVRGLTKDRRGSLLISEKTETKQQIIDWVKSLSPETLRRVRYIVGHRVFRELEDLIPGESVFATSVRYPTDLYASLYNFWLDIALDPTHMHYIRNREMMFLGSTPISFLEWLDSRDDWLHMYARVLARAESGPEAPGIPLPEVNQNHIDSAKQFLVRCDFILELTQSQLDVPRFFKFCGISSPRKHARVSTKHASASKGSVLWNEADRIIRKRSQSDFELYAFATERRESLLREVHPAQIRLDKNAQPENF